MKETQRVAAVGTFDGVHRGHREVINLVKGLASERGLTPSIVTFDCHPLEVIRPERAPQRILPPTETETILSPEGIDVIMVAFSKETAALTAQQWMRKLRDEYGVCIIVMGYDNVFGCDGTNLNIADYQRIGRELGIEVVKAPEIKGVSSSAIRDLVANGKIEEAEKLLGHPFRIAGKVSHGNEIGRSLGYPTANISMAGNQLIPRFGVYIVDVLLSSGKRHRGIANVGTRPTIGKQQSSPLLEVYILDFDAELYQQRITVEFIKFLRPEIKFATLQLLKEQISKDAETAKNYN